MDFLLSGLLHLKTVSAESINTPTRMINFFVTLTTLSAIFYMNFLLAFKSLRYDKLKSDQQLKFKFLRNTLKQTSFYSRHYKPMYLFKDILLALFIVFLEISPVVQILFCLMTSSSFAVMSALKRPFESRRNNILDIFTKTLYAFIDLFFLVLYILQ